MTAIPADQKSRSWGTWIAISLLLHIVLTFLLGKWIPYFLETASKPPASDDLEISLVSPLNGQIVDLLRRKPTAPPKDTRYLAQQNQSVEKQTQAKQTALNPPVQLEKRMTPAPDKGLKLKISEDFLTKDRKKLFESGSPSNYLPNIDLGNETLLNAREYGFSSFFIRMKREMEAVWNPHQYLAMRPSSKSLMITKVLILMDRQGHLKDVSLLESSGRRDLDQEALRTVRQAAPYLNPPLPLFEGKTELSLPWHFVITAY